MAYAHKIAITGILNIMHVDQAHNLKKIIEGSPRPKNGKKQKRIFGFLSGKGGVGKSVIALNSAILLADRGLNVLLVDADFMTPSLHVLSNHSPKNSIELWLQSPELQFEQIRSEISDRLHLVTSEGKGYDVHLKDWQYVKLLRRVLHEAKDYDVVLIDFPTGFFPFMEPLFLELDEIILVTTPEPTSIIDTYAMIKILSKEITVTNIKVLVNMAENNDEANESVENLNRALTHFLSIAVENLPHILFSSLIKESVKLQKPISYENPALFSLVSDYLAYCLH